MKQPRLKDFDPKTSVPRLGSPMDDLPQIGRPVAPAASPAPSPVPQSSVRSNVRPDGRTGGRRVITRYAFEFYQDQVDALRQMSLEDKLQGQKGSMSEMVREAVDEYIAKRTRTGE